MCVEADPEGVAAASAAGEDDDVGGRKEEKATTTIDKSWGRHHEGSRVAQGRTSAGSRPIERHGPHGGGVPPVGVGSCSSIMSFNLARQFEDGTDQRKLPTWPWR
jgi:hypothetical protein